MGGVSWMCLLGWMGFCDLFVVFGFWVWHLLMRFCWCLMFCVLVLFRWWVGVGYLVAILVVMFGLV